MSRVEAVAGAAATLTGGGVGGGIGGGVGGGGADGIGLGAGGLSPEAVDSLSKRLTTAEMKGIIQLTERGRRLEAKASALQAEKEDLHARLQVRADGIMHVGVHRLLLGGIGEFMRDEFREGLGGVWRSRGFVCGTFWRMPGLTYGPEINMPRFPIGSPK